MSRRTLPLAATLGAVVLLVGQLLIPLSADAALPPARAAADPPSAAVVDDSWTATKTLTRHYFGKDGQPQEDTRTVTLTADKHTELQARERVHLTWKGAHPTGGRAANPFGVSGLSQEYPVLIMECRGLDDPSLPADQQLSPSTCWTSSFYQRSISKPKSAAVWLDDAQNTDADRQQVAGIDPDKVPARCSVGTAQYYHITPFVATDGTFYAGCDASDMPPAASAENVEPTNEMAAFTGTDGRGLADFEVRTDLENEALGCSDTVPCSIVVIPVMGLSCASADNKDCNATGAFEPGSSNFDNLGVDMSVSPSLWWSPSNWNNRFSVPLTFAPPPNTCTLGSSGDPVPFYGSELLSQAALQWAPSYCLNPDRFNWQANTMPDDQAVNLVKSGDAIAAQPAGRVEDDDQVAYAPTAVSGWGIAFAVDKPSNTGQQLTLRLNARLLAKLLTESYPGSILARARPGLENNPLSMNLDPEFQKLNPGLDQVRFSEAASTLLSLSTGSDVIEQLTAYIAADPEAMDFIHGKPDKWGMKVNPAYEDVSLPVSTWPLLDTWYPKKTGQECLDQNPAPYLPKVAAPVSSLRLIATAMLLNWPNVNTLCVKDFSTGLWKLGRIEQQGIGNRFMFGLVTLADAARYNLTVAKLQASPGHFVAADQAGIESAVRQATQPAPLKPFEIGQDRIRKSETSYPGAMVVYTAALAKGLDEAAAKQVAQFIDVSTTDGQVPGRGNGELPAGYVPITDSGATAELYTAAQKARATILAQDGMKELPDDEPTDDPTSSPTTGGDGGDDGADGGDGSDGGADLPGVSAPGDAPSAPGDVPTDVEPSDTPTPSATSDAPVVTTAAVSTGLGNGLLPTLVVVGLLATLAAGFGRIALRFRGVK